MALVSMDDRLNAYQDARAVDWKRPELARALSDVAELPGIDAEAISWLKQKLADETFNLVVAGQFKRGKSSVINSLLGDRLLPVGVIPLTSVVTVIRSGPTVRARVEFLDGRAHDLALEALADYVTERGNPRNVKRVRQAVIEHPSAWLANGVQIIDTPGIGSIYEHNTDVTQEYLPQADAVLLIASVDQPVSRAELDFLSNIRQYAGKIFCLLNKTDYLHAQELSEALTFARDAIRTSLSAEVPIFPVSARLALESKLTQRVTSADSGFPDLERALQEFMAHEKNAVWIHSIARAVLRILAQARFALQLEAKILGTPLLQAEDKLAAFERKKRELERALVDYQVLMQAGARALVREQIEPSLEQFKRGEQARIGALVGEWFEQSRSLCARQLDATLEGHTMRAIRAAYDGWLLRENAAASAAFEKLCGRFWAELQGSVDELLRYSGELFAVKFESLPEESRWSPDSGFYYKFWYEPSGLTAVSAAVVNILPRFLSNKLIFRRRKARALELVEMQAGRLRYDFEQRVEQSAQNACRRMMRRIETTIAEIQTAIESGLTARRQGAEQVLAGMARAKSAVEGIAAIEARVKAVDTTD
jgi:GTP-binding protein EngB required for normal cell division